MLDEVFELIRKIFANRWAVCLLCSLLGALAAAVATHWEIRSMWREWLSGGVAGLSLGLFYVIDTSDRYSKKNKKIISGVVGTLAGIIMAALLAASMPTLLISAFIGMTLGFTSGVWIYHVNLP